MRGNIGTLPYIPAGFEVSTPPPPQAASLGVTDMGDGWTVEAFEDSATGIQYLEYWHDSSGEMLWYANDMTGGGRDTLAVTDSRWSESANRKWMWAGIAAGLGAVAGIVVQRSQFPQHNPAIVAGLGAVVLGGAGYFAYGMTQGGMAGIGRRPRRQKRSTVPTFNIPSDVRRYW